MRPIEDVRVMPLEEPLEEPEKALAAAMRYAVWAAATAQPKSRESRDLLAKVVFFA
jgi:hypothetical protein